MLKFNLVDISKYITLWLACGLLIIPVTVLAETSLLPSHAVISQIQTNGLDINPALEEFVEIFNPTDQTINLAGWRLRYISSTGSMSTAKNFYTISDNTNLYPRGYLVIGSDKFMPTTDKILRYSTVSFSGLSFDGATVDLIDEGGQLIDRVGWGDKPAIVSETSPSLAPIKGGSIVRKLNDSIMVDTDNNFADFERADISIPNIANNIDPTPLDPPGSQTDPPIYTPPEHPQDEDQNPAPANPAPNPVEQTTPPSTPEPEAGNASQLLPIKLNELMVDPASPLSDSYDEWVELYNPNQVEVLLSGYRLESGLTGSYKYTLKDQTIPGLGYLIITSKDTPISLTNSSGKVVLFDAQNNLIDEVNYDKAETGNSYARNELGQWLWTTTPTGSSANSFSYPLTASVSTAAKTAVTKTTKKPTTTQKVASTTKKAATTKAAKPKTVKKATIVSGAKDDASKQLIAAPTPVPGSVLAVLVALAILYCCYEYRYEVANKFHQFKLYRKNR